MGSLGSDVRVPVVHDPRVDAAPSSPPGAGGGPTPWPHRVALGLVLATAVVGALFAGGEAIDDPGGWRGVGLVALWLVPGLGLAVAAWRRPDRMRGALAVLTAVYVALGLCAVLVPETWRTWLDRRGPVLALALLVLAAPLALLARHRPLGGLLLLVAAIAAPVAQQLGGHGAGGGAVLRLLALVLAPAALLFLLSGPRPTPRPHG